MAGCWPQQGSPSRWDWVGGDGCEGGVATPGPAGKGSQGAALVLEGSLRSAPASGTRRQLAALPPSLSCAACRPCCPPHPSTLAPPRPFAHRCASTRLPRGCSTPTVRPTCSRCAATACPPSSAPWPGTPTRLALSQVSGAAALRHDVAGGHGALGALCTPDAFFLRIRAATPGALALCSRLLTVTSLVQTVADYDGVVSQVDMESGHLIAEADEHCGRR